MKEGTLTPWILMFFFFIMMAMAHNDLYQIKMQAIKNGAAEWKVEDDGQTSFRWKNNPGLD